MRQAARQMVAVAAVIAALLPVLLALAALPALAAGQVPHAGDVEGLLRPWFPGEPGRS